MTGNSATSIVCKDCGGKAHYDFNKGSYQCGACAQARKLKTQPPVVERRASALIPLQPRGAEVSLQELESRHKIATQGDQSQSVTLVDCRGCGAQVEIPADESLGECPFCERKVTNRPAPSTSSLHDPTVVPFGIDQSRAVGKMAEHVSRLWLRPNFLRKLILSGRHMRKVYLPFWAFDVAFETDWEASVRRRKKPGLWGKLTGDKGRYEVSRYAGSRCGRRDDWLVCASQGLGPELIEDLQPFSLDQNNPRPMTDVAGKVPLECGVLGPEEAWERAKVELRRREYRVSRDQAKKEGQFGDNDDATLSGQVALGEPLGKAVMLPLYILSAKTPYGRVQIVVNGETGKVAARVPYSWLKVAPLAAAGTGAAGLACAVSFGGLAPIVLGGVAWGWYSQKKRREQDEATFLAR